MRELMRQNDISTMQARALHYAPTLADHALWQALRDRRLMGLKFRRQVSLGSFCVRFFCAERVLILEAAGDGNDLTRNRLLQNRGFRTLPLTDRDILDNLPGCPEWIARNIAP